MEILENVLLMNIPIATVWYIRCLIIFNVMHNSEGYSTVYTLTSEFLVNTIVSLIGYYIIAGISNSYVPIGKYLLFVLLSVVGYFIIHILSSFINGSIDTLIIKHHINKKIKEDAKKDLK
ncbi:hypothetical protein SAC12B_0180 [Lactobacillus phage SAC12B]|uniref:Uncharacterized protein n=1 Tax=Lactobacillus phage SAC12B TaxID=2510941 RepID=A0A4Y5FFP5_9CAUD|nr:hypothetical protein HWC10_gp121 [Lactobacillus phage SAC12B]QBJ03969.1 hypothetical protein SAC12B_0180 [Lactobacillus phage SAC12B]